jgi:hypothetical protein
MITTLHKDLAAGRWYMMSLCEQMAHIGSEVSRAKNWQGRDKKNFDGAVDRALELFDFTITDPRWRGRLREIARAREVFLDATFDSAVYGSSLEDLDRYFFEFALCVEAGINKKPRGA